MKQSRTPLLLLALLALLAAACGDGATADDAISDEATEAASEEEVAAPSDASDDDAMAEDEAGSDFPATIESDGGTFTLEAAPERIVSLSPSATETLFAIGAGEQVIAVDAFSNYPAEAPVTELSGWDPNVEAVVGYEPDLVVIANDANELVASLTALDIPVLISAAPADIESGYAGMAELGVATGRVDETATVIADMRANVEAALAMAPDTEVRVYHELDETYFSASSNGFVGSIYASMGATNISDEADTDGSGYPQLTEEYIVEADPQVIVITDQVTYGPDEVAARPGWSDISAVQNDNVVVVNADIASRWGPRLPEFITTVADALTTSAAE